jgi:glycosyltransferase involved in cell wall biosynthesis
LVDIYKNAYIFVFPSLLESFGNAPLEAMACGCPVLASNAPAIPEVCGDAALYFDPYDPQDMADKIKKVLKDDILRKELITKGYQRVKKYTWEESAQKLLAIMVQAVDS